VERKDKFQRAFCFHGFVHCFWRSEDKKGTSSKSVNNKCCLCQTNFSCNNGKGWVLSNFRCHTTRNQQRSTHKLAPIRDVFESTISRFQKAYTSNEHITNDEQLVVFRGKCPFCVFTKTKPGKYGIKLWSAADAQNFYACNMQE